MTLELGRKDPPATLCDHIRTSSVQTETQPAAPFLFRGNWIVESVSNGAAITASENPNNNRRPLLAEAALDLAHRGNEPDSSVSALGTLQKLAGQEGLVPHGTLEPASLGTEWRTPFLFHVEKH